MVDGDIRYGTTEYIANMIAEKVGGALHRIETVTSYTADFDELRDVNHDEMNRNYLPELKKRDLDISAYDTAFVGYPVWAADVPQAVLSFLKYKFGNRHFWSEGYYVSTVGLNEATIRKYIQDQEKYDIMQDKLSVKEYTKKTSGSITT